MYALVVVEIVGETNLPRVFRKAEPDFPPEESHLIHLASESKKLSSQLQAARKLANCSAKNIRQKIEALLLSKSEERSFSLKRQSELKMGVP